MNRKNTVQKNNSTFVWVIFIPIKVTRKITMSLIYNISAHKIQSHCNQIVSVVDDMDNLDCLGLILDLKSICFDLKK